MQSNCVQLQGWCRLQVQLGALGAFYQLGDLFLLLLLSFLYQLGGTCWWATASLAPGRGPGLLQPVCYALAGLF